MRSFNYRASRMALHKIGSLIITLAMILELCGCSIDSGIAEYKISEKKTLSSTVLAENDNYTLKWNDNAKSVILENRHGDYIWSTVPYEFLKQDKKNVNLNSPLFIEYYTPDDGTLQSAKAYSDCIELDNLSVNTIKNGIRLLFHFTDAEITIPLDCFLRDDSVLVSIPYKDIKESGKSKLISISVLPYFCSVQNTADKSSYLFVPSGAGAIMYTDEEIQTVSRGFTGDVYGIDDSEIVLDNPSKQEPIRIPVYGVTCGDNSLMAIIEEGEGAARITAEAGNIKNNYSTVYATVKLRGGDQTEAQRDSYNDEVIYSNTYNKDGLLAIGFYPLSGKESGYSGMAKAYRAFLQKDNEFSNNEIKKGTYHINFLGGAMTKNFFLGLPYQSFKATTTFAQASEILEDLKNTLGSPSSVTLYGFTQSGVDTGKIAGGFKFSKSLGGNKDIKALNSFCKDNKISLFADFDVVYYSKSSGGYSTLLNTAKTAERQSAKKKALYYGTRTENSNTKNYYLLQREKLNAAIQKTQEIAKNKEISLSLSTLGRVAYSDYSDSKYYVKGDIGKQVGGAARSIRKDDILLASDSANSYMAKYSNMISNVPIDNGGYVNLDESVPFYSMVFGKSSDLYSPPINLNSDPDRLLLKSVESGVAPSFTFTSDYHDKLSNSSFERFYGTEYKNQKNRLKEMVERTASYYKKISNQYVVSHEILKPGVSKTVFSNGTKVYVNCTDEKVNDFGVEIGAKSFYYGE